MLDVHVKDGFTEIYPPPVTRRETLVASAHLPHFDENLYRDEDDDIWMIPTAEPQLVSLHRDETIPFEKLPLRYVAYTPCFRREHMSAGRDVRGIKRVHWFDKVEMVVLTTPEASRQMLDELTARATMLLERLELPVQVNGRLRDRVPVRVGLGQEEIESIVMARPKVKANLQGKQVVRVVHVPGRLVNIVVR